MGAYHFFIHIERLMKISLFRRGVPLKKAGLVKRSVHESAISVSVVQDDGPLDIERYMGKFETSRKGFAFLDS